MGEHTDWRREVPRILADQDGVITTAQARASGMSAGVLAARVRRGDWERVGYGTYLSIEHTFTDAARLRAAVAATGGVADSEAAAWWHGVLPDLVPTIGVTVGHGRRRTPAFAGALRLRRRNLLPADLEVVRGLAVTRLPLTLLDCVAALPDAARLLDRTLQEGRVLPSGLRSAWERNAGRTGMAKARRLVTVVESDTESEAERRFAKLLVDEGIGGWRPQLTIGRYRADFAWPAERLVVEVDGWAFHRDAVRFQRDHDKWNALTRAGWTVLGFTWHDIDSDPVGTVESVVALLRDRRARIG